jgi:putative endonuclease
MTQLNKPMPDTLKNKVVYWVYILNCSNGSYYTGYTTQLVRRYQEHLLGSDKCKYTRSFKPLGIAQYWQIVGTKSTAMQVEKFIKRLSKQKKTQLIVCPDYLSQWFYHHLSEST